MIASSAATPPIPNTIPIRERAKAPDDIFASIM
jgi:hypothetical protein